jgi:hypothetical protein
MPRIEKKVTKEEFDHYVSNYPRPLHVKEYKAVPPHTTLYIRGTVTLAAHNQEDVIAMIRNHSVDKGNANTEDAYYLYEEVE